MYIRSLFGCCASRRTQTAPVDANGEVEGEVEMQHDNAWAASNNESGPEVGPMAAELERGWNGHGAGPSGDLPPPPSKIATALNGLYAGVQAAARDFCSVSLASALVLPMRAALMMAGAQSSKAADAVTVGSGLAAAGIYLATWPRAAELIQAPTRYRNSKPIMILLRLLPALATVAAIWQAPADERENRLKLAVLLLSRELANLARDTCTQSQAGAWGSLDAVTADGQLLTASQVEQLRFRRALGATVVYAALSYIALTLFADHLYSEYFKDVGQTMKDPYLLDGLDPSTGELLHNKGGVVLPDDHCKSVAGVSVSAYLSCASYLYNLQNESSRYIAAVVLEAADGLNTGGIAPLLAGLSMGLRYRYKPGGGPAQVKRNWNSPEARSATLERIKNNGAMRIGLGMGGDIVSSMSLRTARGDTQWTQLRYASVALNTLTEVRGTLVEAGVAAQDQARRQTREQATSARLRRAEEIAGDAQAHTAWHDPGAAEDRRRFRVNIGENENATVELEPQDGAPQEEPNLDA